MYPKHICVIRSVYKHMDHLFTISGMGTEDRFYKRLPEANCLAKRAVNTVIRFYHQRKRKRKKEEILFAGKLTMYFREGKSLENTPTWSVATICSVFIMISMGIKLGFHYLGKTLKKHNRKSLFEALEILKEELMLLGFISILLSVFKNIIRRICISKSLTHIMLPCRVEGYKDDLNNLPYISLSPRDGEYCELKGKVPLLSTEDMHHLHKFIFVLAIVHVVYCVLTMVLGTAKIHSWKCWEDEIKESLQQSQYGTFQKILTRDVTNDSFVMNHTNGPCTESTMLQWNKSFWRQFYGSVKRSDYTTLRLGFVEAHCRANKNFDFHNYLLRSLEVDFKMLVGISGYLWAFVVVFLLLNIHGWNTYFWLAFLPLILLLVVGTKLQNVITRMAQDVIKRNTAEQGEIIVRPSDDYFWFGRPQLVLHLIHFILFQNAFELAFTLWIMINFGVTSCMLSKVGYMIPKVLMGIMVQVLCSYSTFPLYALVSQMGCSFKRSIFEEHIQECISGWYKKAKTKSKAKFSKNRANGKSCSSKRLKVQCLDQSAATNQILDAVEIKIDRP